MDKGKQTDQFLGLNKLLHSVEENEAGNLIIGMF